MEEFTASQTMEANPQVSPGQHLTRDGSEPVLAASGLSKTFVRGVWPVRRRV